MMFEESTPVRNNARYPFAVHMIVELSNGLFRPVDLVDALLVDLSQGGAAMLAPGDPRLKAKKRYRVLVDDHEGIVRTTSIVPYDDTKVRVGLRFERLALELQEIVADAVQDAQARASRVA